MFSNQGGFIIFSQIGTWKTPAQKKPLDLRRAHFVQTKARKINKADASGQRSGDPFDQ
jgi:hypothetical protein